MHRAEGSKQKGSDFHAMLLTTEGGTHFLYILWDVSEAFRLLISTSERSLMFKKATICLLGYIPAGFVIGRGVIMEESSVWGEGNQLLDIRA